MIGATAGAEVYEGDCAADLAELITSSNKRYPPTTVGHNCLLLGSPTAFEFRDPSSSLSAFKLHGNVNANVDPLPTSLRTQMRPPCISTNRFVSASPSPVPSGLFWSFVTT